MRKNFRFVILNLALILLLYFGLFSEYFQGNVKEGILNLAIFYMWVLGFISLFFLSERVRQGLKSQGYNPPTWKRMLSFSTDIAAICMVVYQGYIWLPVFYVIGMLIQAGFIASLEN